MTPHQKPSAQPVHRGLSDQPFHVGPTLETLRQWFKQHQPSAQWADEDATTNHTDSLSSHTNAVARPRLQPADWQALAEGLVERMSSSPQALDALAQAMAQQWQATNQPASSPEKQALEQRTWQRYHVKEANQSASQAASRLPNRALTQQARKAKTQP